MSGIYIPGMEMPTSCAECLDIGWHYVFECHLDDMEDGERLPTCPLVPVPEHGDLIDKSGVDVLSWTEDPEKDFADGVLFVLDKLDELPVIIPADGEDYEVPADGNLYDSLKRGLEQAINGESRSETVPADKEGEG